MRNSEVSAVVSCVLDAALEASDLGAATLEEFKQLLHDQQVEACESIAVECDEADKPSSELLGFVKQIAQPAPHPATKAAPQQHRLVLFNSNSSESFNNIKLVEKGESRNPVCAEDWDRVRRRLELNQRLRKFHEEHLKPLMDKGCSKEQIFTKDNTSLRKDFYDILNMVGDLTKVLANDTDELKKFLANLDERTCTQTEIRKLSKEIQALKAELLSSNVVLKQSKSLTGRERTTLEILLQYARNLRNSDDKGGAKKNAGKARRNNEFEDAVRGCLVCMPLIVMTTEQVSRFMGVDQRVDLCLVDEASQSCSTAVTLLVRAKRMVVIGDDKQVSPYDHKLTEDAINFLNASTPKVPAGSQLTPQFSFFTICHIAFPDYAELLEDHFRCPADSVDWNNKAVYHKQMNLFKPSGIGPSKMSVRVNGAYDKKLKINQIECNKIVDFVFQEISEAAAGNRPVQTIGIASMSGNDQCKLIKESLDKKLDPLEVNYGSDIVKRHKIIIGECSKLQGGDCDIVLLSCVRDSKSVENEVEQEDEKRWNVATTRQKSRTVLFHSFDKEDIKGKDDPKREIFIDYIHAQKTFETNSWEGQSHDVCTMAEKKLGKTLENRGYTIRRNKSNVWSNALCVGRKHGPNQNKCALICIENYGELDDTWSMVVEQQLDLEKAGTACLRVDALSLALRFPVVADSVVNFLSEAGFPPAHPPVLLVPPTPPPPQNIVISDSSTDTVSLSSLSSKKVSTTIQQRKRKARTAVSSVDDSSSSMEGVSATMKQRTQGAAAKSNEGSSSLPSKKGTAATKRKASPGASRELPAKRNSKKASKATKGKK